MTKGFTLIETIIYIALLGLIMAGAVATAYELLNGAGAIDTRNAAQEEGNFVLRKLDWALTGTSSLAHITTPSAGAYAGALSLSRADGTTVDVCLEHKAIWMREHGTGGACADASYVPLTTGNVVVTSLQFHTIPASGAGPAGAEASTTLNGFVFYTTRYVRK